MSSTSLFSELRKLLETDPRSLRVDQILDDIAQSSFCSHVDLVILEDETAAVSREAYSTAPDPDDLEHERVFVAGKLEGIAMFVRLIIDLERVGNKVINRQTS